MSTQTEQQVGECYEKVRSRIAQAAQRRGAAADGITLVAVTKYASDEQIDALLATGHRDLGENRVQQLQQRARALPDDVRWHMIGHLQRNKVKHVLPLVTMIHSVDSARLAKAIDQRAEHDGVVADVLLQVNISGEQRKFGAESEAAVPLAGQMSAMPHLRLRGVMTMAPYSDNPEDARPVFAACRKLYDQLRDQLDEDGRAGFDTLSMGMTGDFEVAIEEGANVVRIGSAIFGGS